MIRTYGSASSGITSGVGLAIAKTIASSAIRSRSRGLDQPGAGEADEQVGALDHLGRRAQALLGVRVLGVPALDLGHLLVVVAAGRERALAVAADDLGDPGGEHHLGHRDAGGAEAEHQHAQVLDRLADDLQRVEQRRHRHHRGAVLVVVEDRDVELLLERLLDLEAARRRDVLEVDAAEGRRHQPHRLDDLLRVVGVEADREGVDVGELLEQHRLALHHRHRRLGADVAEAEHRRAVGDDGDGVLLDREVEGLRAVGGDLHADPGDARRVGHREVVAGLQRVLVVLLDLAAAVHRQRAVDVVDHPRAAGRADRPQDLLPVRLVAGVDRELAHPLALAAGAGHQVDALKRPAGLGDRRGQLAQRLRARVELDAHGDGELGGDGGHGRRILRTRSELPP